MAVTVPAQIVLGLAVAVLLDAHMPARGLFRTLYYLPVVTSWVVVSLLFRYLFITDGGLINWVLHDELHLIGHNIDWLVAALDGARRDQHPRHLEGDRLVDGDLPRRAAERAARAEGGGCGRRREGVGAVPRRLAAAIRPVIAFVTVMLVIGGFNVFISVFLITNGGPLDETQVLLTYMYRAGVLVPRLRLRLGDRVHADADRLRALDRAAAPLPAAPEVAPDGRRQRPSCTRDPRRAARDPDRSAPSLMIVPFAYMVATSLKPNALVLEIPPQLDPAPPDDGELHQTRGPRTSSAATS